jgi:hypothetical protein
MSGRRQERPVVLIAALAVGVAAMAAGRIWPRVLSKLEASPRDAGIPVAALFEAELQKRGLSYFAIDAGLYQISLPPDDGADAGWVITANIENLTRDVLRDSDLGAIPHFIDRVQAPVRWVPWREARDELRWAVEPNDFAFGDTVHFPLTPQVDVALVRSDRAESTIQWLQPKDLAQWSVDELDAGSVASENMDHLLDATPLVMLDGGTFSYAYFDSDSPFKASLLLAPGLRRSIEPKLGWPVFAIAPCRDFVYLVRATDEDKLEGFGGIVKDEYTTSGHPVTTEIWEISDAGIRATGMFEVSRSPRPSGR